MNPTKHFRKGDKSQMYLLQLSDNYKKTVFEEYTLKNKILAKKNYHMGLLFEEMDIYKSKMNEYLGGNLESKLDTLLDEYTLGNIDLETYNDEKYILENKWKL